MEETVNQGNEINANETKTFTQADLDRIVQERVNRERAKYEGFEEFRAKAAKFDEQEEANKSELQKAQERTAELEKKLKEKEHEESVREMKKKVAEEMKVPADLLTGETEDDCKAQAQAILSFAKSQGYPTIKDAGESNPVTKKSARDSFAAWAEENFN